MALRTSNVSYWDLTTSSPGANGVNRALFDDWCPAFLPPDLCADDQFLW